MASLILPLIAFMMMPAMFGAPHGKEEQGQAQHDQHGHGDVHHQSVHHQNCWNSEDKALAVRLSDDNLTAKKAGDSYGSVRSIMPIHGGMSGTFYFEIKIEVLHWKHGWIRVGLSNKQFPISSSDFICGSASQNGSRSCGYFSYGYVWKDGSRIRFDLPTFAVGDVVGCGVVMGTRQLFFTKNGQHLGNVAVLDADVGDMYPSVSLGDATIKANFGSRGFMYPEAN